MGIQSVGGAGAMAAVPAVARAGGSPVPVQAVEAAQPIDEGADALVYNSQGTTNLTSNLQYLRNYVAQILQEQGVQSQVEIDGEVVDITQLAPAEANALLQDDGYFGIDQTAGRIVDFSVALMGGDPSRAAEIRGGLLEGFQATRDAYGDGLPEITEETMRVALERFDAAVEQLGGGAEASP
jgi:hypothetical protein